MCQVRILIFEREKNVEKIANGLLFYWYCCTFRSQIFCVSALLQISELRADCPNLGYATLVWFPRSIEGRGAGVLCSTSLFEDEVRIFPIFFNNGISIWTTVFGAVHSPLSTFDTLYVCRYVLIVSPFSKYKFYKLIYKT